VERLQLAAAGSTGTMARGQIKTGGSGARTFQAAAVILGLAAAYLAFVAKPELQARLEAETQKFIELDVNHKTLEAAHSVKEKELAAAKKTLEGAQQQRKEINVNFEKTKSELQRAKKSKASLETLEQKSRARAEDAERERTKLSADVQKVESEKDTLEKQLQEKHEAELETSKRMEELQHESSQTSASLATMTKGNKALQLKYDALQDSVKTSDKQSEQVAASLKVSEVKILELQNAKKSLQVQLKAAASKSKKKIPVCPKCPSCSQLVAQSAVAAALPHKRGPPVLRPPEAPPVPGKRRSTRLRLLRRGPSSVPRSTSTLRQAAWQTRTQ